MQYLIWTAAQPDPVAAEAALVASDPTFDQWKKKYDTSKRTVTRTDYEVCYMGVWGVGGLSGVGLG